MRMFTTVLMCAVLLSSCADKIYPVKGEYAPKNFEAISDNSKDKVWDNIIDLFAKKGLSIKIIDRSSGLIISSEALLSTTHEKPKGGLYNPDAFAVAEKVFPAGSDGKGTNFYKIQFTGEWNVRIKDAPNAPGKTLINVNLIIPPQKQYVVGKTVVNVGKAYTTGVFEKIIFDAVK